jgi:hypothetical protein
MKINADVIDLEAILATNQHVIHAIHQPYASRCRPV